MDGPVPWQKIRPAAGVSRRGGCWSGLYLDICTLLSCGRSARAWACSGLTLPNARAPTTAEVPHDKTPPKSESMCLLEHRRPVGCMCSVCRRTDLLETSEGLNEKATAVKRKIVVDKAIQTDDNDEFAPPSSAGSQASRPIKVRT